MTVAELVVADVQRREREGLRLLLVAADVRGRHGVQRRVDHVQRPDVAEMVDAHVVVRVEAGEPVGMAVAARRAEEASGSAASGMPFSEKRFTGTNQLMISPNASSPPPSTTFSPMIAPGPRHGSPRTEVHSASALIR